MGMSRERYPLEAALALRAEEEAAQTRALADALRRRERALDALRGAEQAAAAHRDETARVHEDELARDRAGRSIDEMLRARSFLDRRGREQRDHATAIERARASEREAARHEMDARTALATAIAEREAIERHHATWLEARRKEAEKKEDEESEEHASRRG